MHLSEMLTIVIIFHLSQCKVFKHFYDYHVAQLHKDDFPTLINYSRFVQLMPRLFTTLCILMKSKFGEKTALYIADPTCLPVCYNKRISRNRVFKGIAEREKTTKGWFYELKLHIVINHKGDIVGIKITSRNTDERSILDNLTQTLQGKIFADKGFISKKLFSKLYKRGLKMITELKRNMKNYLMEINEKLLLRKRFLVETVFDVLKVHMNLIHTRHRSVTNCMVNILSF